MRERGTGFLLEEEERPSKSERRGKSLSKKEVEGDEGSILRRIDTFGLGSASWIRVGVRLIRVSDQSDQISNQRDMDSQIVIVDQFAAAVSSIQEVITSLVWRIDEQQAQQVPP